MSVLIIGILVLYFEPDIFSPLRFIITGSLSAEATAVGTAAACMHYRSRHNILILLGGNYLSFRLTWPAYSPLPIQQKGVLYLCSSPPSSISQSKTKMQVAEPIPTSHETPIAETETKEKDSSLSDRCAPKRLRARERWRRRRAKTQVVFPDVHNCYCNVRSRANK